MSPAGSWSWTALWPTDTVSDDEMWRLNGKRDMHYRKTEDMSSMNSSSEGKTR